MSATEVMSDVGMGETVSHLAWCLVRQSDEGTIATTRRIDGVLFDLDDTLIDWWGSLQTWLDEFAPAEVAEQLLQHVRDEWWEVRPGTTHVWHRNTWAVHHYRHTVWAAALPQHDPDDMDRLLADFDRTLSVDFFDDAVSTLDLLVERGVHRLGVLSNNHLLAIEAERLGLATWFDVLVSAEQHLVKPHPAAFHRGCQLLDTLPEHTVYVGDSVKADALGALAAGLIPVWVDRYDDPWPDRPAGVHRISALADLPVLLASL
jgi:putative hydrolase of the HAD superfamily